MYVIFIIHHVMYLPKILENTDRDVFFCIHWCLGTMDNKCE